MGDEQNLPRGPDGGIELGGYVDSTPDFRRDAPVKYPRMAAERAAREANEAKVRALADASPIPPGDLQKLRDWEDGRRKQAEWYPTQAEQILAKPPPPDIAAIRARKERFEQQQSQKQAEGIAAALAAQQPKAG